MAFTNLDLKSIFPISNMLDAVGDIREAQGFGRTKEQIHMKKQRKLENTNLSNNKLYTLYTVSATRDQSKKRDWDVCRILKEDFSLGNIFKTLNTEVDLVTQVKYFTGFKI